MKINSLYSYFLIFSLLFSVGTLSSCASSETTTEETTEDISKEITEETVNTDQEAPTKFTNLDEMIIDLGDYTTDNNTYEKVSDTQIRISPPVSASADEAQIEDVVKASMISIALRTFIHTDLAEVTIKVIPQKASMNPEDEKMMKKYTQEATITRQKTEEVAKKFAGTDLNSLVGNKIGELFRPDMPNDNLEKLRGTQNLNAVFSALTEK
ncbi:hypothetical protein Fleli_3701 [Bernardetia litoralis DSM 6794]|uniref:Lipoprotein n=1 Tax=Bernardetia litoralis (strain ATCC 23117 / DSM 6794 / NBRC 15988 / NCIMB 1366 / Fx l1 / Sio-4) TaxID=880071 RepID=I4APX8_BERLS|nr:hypothetical protein [Bernardetia litoralis]AFM06013.1 hypothetical protein Fleli_3701 [Bernardetia litoralis DSM 6794]